MKDIARKLITAFLFIICSLVSNAQDIFKLGYCEHKIATSNGQGSDAAGEVSACIYVPGNKLKALAGNNITRIDAGFINRTNVKDLTVWIRSAIDGENLSSATVARGQLGWNELALTSPYTIPSDCEGLYIGFTFSNQAAAHPVSFVNEGQKGTSFLKTSAEGTWKDMAEYGNLSIEAVVEGSTLPLYDLELLEASVFPNLSVGIDGYRLNGKVANVAAKNVSGFTLTIKTQDATVNVPVNVSVNSGMQATFSTDFNSPNHLSGPCVITLSALNEGEDNDENNNSVSSTISYLKNVLIEEFTTERCPNCPNGAQTLHNVLHAKEEYKDRVFAVCHHSAFYTDNFTQPCDKDLVWLFNDNGSSYAPAFMFNRMPIFRSQQREGEMDNVTSVGTVQSFCNYIDEIMPSTAHAIVGISIDKIEKCGDGEDVTLTVNVEQDGNFSAVNPSLTLYVTEDDVDAIKQEGPTGAVPGFRHQHLIRAYNSTWGDAISFTDNRWSNTYVMRISDGWYKEKLHFLAVISNHDETDKLNNQIENSVSIDYPSDTDGISLITDSKHTVVRRYDANGMQINERRNGLNIIKYSDGSVKKVFVAD